MKIALVRARYTPHGGAERFAARALEAIAAQRDEATELTVIARRWDGVANSGTRLILRDPFHVGSTWRDASFAHAVRQVVAGESFDLVQSHERIVGLPIYRAGDGVHAAWLARRSRTASLATRLGIALNPHHRYLLLTERAMFEHRGLRAVICNSRMVVDEITTRFEIDPAKLVLVRNGVDIDRFHPDACALHRATMRRTLDIADDTPTFVLVGSGFERKGVDAALGALRRMKDAALIVVGADKHAARYRARSEALGLAGRVHFTGPVDDPLPYLAMADVFVLPTLYDPFPNAALEAWACGLPVITSEASGAAELVTEDNGWVVRTDVTRSDDRDDSVEALVVAMRAAARRDAGRIAAMRAAARRTAEPLSLAALADALTSLYRRLLDEAR